MSKEILLWMKNCANKRPEENMLQQTIHMKVWLVVSFSPLVCDKRIINCESNPLPVTSISISVLNPCTYIQIVPPVWQLLDKD